MCKHEGNCHERECLISDKEYMLGEDGRGPDFCFGWQSYLPYSDKGDIEVFAPPGHSFVVKCSSLEESLIQKHPRNKNTLKKSIENCKPP